MLAGCWLVLAGRWRWLTVILPPAAGPASASVVGGRGCMLAGTSNVTSFVLSSRVACLRWLTCGPLAGCMQATGRL